MIRRMGRKIGLTDKRLCRVHPGCLLGMCEPGRFLMQAESHEVGQGF